MRRGGERREVASEERGRAKRGGEDGGVSGEGVDGEPKEFRETLVSLFY